MKLAFVLAAATAVNATTAAVAADPASRVLYTIKGSMNGGPSSYSEVTFVNNGPLPFGEAVDVLPLSCLDQGALCSNVTATNLALPGHTPDLKVKFPTHSMFLSNGGQPVSDYDTIYSYVDTQGNYLTFLHEGYFADLGDGSLPLRTVSCNFFSNGDGYGCAAARLNVVNGLGQLSFSDNFGNADQSIRFPAGNLTVDGRYMIKASGSNPAAQLTIIGALVVRPADVTPSVPEPATWGLMMLGLGAVGATLRRRPRVNVRFA